jgi:hypothetical protein
MNREQCLEEARSGKPNYTERLFWGNHLAGGLCLLSMLASTGCAHFGPKTVAVDRFDYRTAIATH